MVRILLSLALAASLCAVPVPSAAISEDIAARVTATSGVAQTVARKCGACHSQEFSLWISHPHSRFLIEPGKSPRGIAARWGSGVPGWDRFVAKSFSKADVALAYGVIQIQVYFRRDRDGHRLLPAQWNLEASRWERLPAPLEKLRQERGTWEANCAGCHVTGFNPADGTYTEKNASCVMCHGSGTEHLASGGQKPILRPSALSARSRSELCGSCHSRGRDRKTQRPYPVGFVPGSPLEEVFELEKPEAGKATEYFWPDGTERRSFMEFQGFQQSGHYRAGLSCTTCHLAHGSDYPFNLRHKTVDLCQSCHQNVAGKTAVHRAHPKASATCVDCHMAVALGEANDVHFHTHTFRILEPSNSLSQGMPNSCTGQCHAGRDARWADGVLKGWKGR